VRAMRCEAYGPPDDLVLRELPDPEPAPGEIVVRIEGAAVNFPDTLFIQDKYQISMPVPFTPGSEFAGLVHAIAPDVTSVAVGDRVMGGAMSGAYAELIAVPASSVTPIPDGLAGPEAAAFQVTFRTAYHGLRTIGALEPGKWVVVLGAAGGVGTAGVDIAVRLGARVIAVDRGGARLAGCTELGAEAVIDVDTEDVKVRIKEITGGGADLVIDPVGGAVSEQALRSTTWGARFVVIGFAAGEIPKIPLNLVLLKGTIIRGFEIRTLPDLLPEAYAAGELELRRLVADGLRPLVAEVFPLERTADAMNALLDRKVTGKVVIDPTR
jgi:NADPH2:quinone reductase